MTAINDDVCMLVGALEGTWVTQPLGQYLAAVGKAQSMEAGGPTRMALYLIDHSTYAPEAGAGGAAIAPIPKKTTAALERGLVRLGKRINEAGCRNSHFLRIWRRPEHMHTGRLCIQPRRLRKLATETPLTQKQWARFEKACKPKLPGSGSQKAKPPTIGTILRVASSLLGGVGNVGGGGGSRGTSITMSLVDTLEQLFTRSGVQVQQWEFIASQLLSGLGKII